MWDFLVNQVMALLQNPQVLVAGVLALLGFIKAEGTRNLIARMALIAYEEAQKAGFAKELKGFQKLEPFMVEFSKQWQEKYGSLPPAYAEAYAHYVAAREAQLHSSKKS